MRRILTGPNGSNISSIAASSIPVLRKQSACGLDRLGRIDIKMGGRANFHIDDGKAAVFDDGARIRITLQIKDLMKGRPWQDDRVSAHALIHCPHDDMPVTP